jgi:hypothetical protein
MQCREAQGVKRMHPAGGAAPSIVAAKGQEISGIAFEQ